MLPLFCLRLAVGLLACLLLLRPWSAHAARPYVGPRFFRTHFLTALALACAALLFVRESAGWPELVVLGGAVALAFAGSVSWSLEGAPGGVALILLTLAALLAGLVLRELGQANREGAAQALVGGLSSAALLGAALTAMLMGHSYLISPTMSIGPLVRLLAVLAVALAARALVDGGALAHWISDHSLGNLEGDGLLWLPVRWGVGLVAPAVLAWMAWQTARIRSTQSATGILYVVVIFCFLGELTGLLLRQNGLTL
jgi:hypothetical protein